MFLILEKLDCTLEEYIDQANRNIINYTLEEEEAKHIVHRILMSSLFASFTNTHKDIKLANFMIQKSQGKITVKVADFGFAKFVTC